MSASEEMYRRIVKAVPQGIWVVSPQGRTIFCNERMAELLGTDVESLQRLSCFDSVFPDDLEEAQRQFGLQVAGGGQPFDFRLRRINGSAVWVSISCMPMHDDRGGFIGLLGLFTDISERRRAESGLRESEERFRAIFSQAAVGITQCGVTGEWLLMNDRFCEMVGYTRAELQGKTVFDITHPEDREACTAAVNRLLAGEIPSYPTEKRYIRKGGSVIWVRVYVTPVWGADKRLQFFIGVVEDITEKVQIEHALRDSEQHLALAQNAARLGVWDCDLRTNTTSISGEYARLHGLKPDHPPLTHEEWMELVHPADRERVQEHLRESIDKTHLWDTEFRLLWPDGSLHWLLGKGKVFLDESGVPVHMAGVSLDITERKRNEEALRVSQERLELAQGAGGIGIWDWNATTGETYCSSAYGPLYGLPPGYIAPPLEQWLELIYPEDRVKIREELERAFERTDQFSAEFRVVWPDGTIHWLLGKGQVYRDSGGHPIRMAGVNMDISERKRSEAALRESEERFRRVFEEGPLGLALVGKNYQFEKVNSALCQMVGYSEAELLQRSFVDITHPDDFRANVELAERLFRREIPFFQLRKRYVKKNGEIIWINLTASLIHDQEGEPLHGLAMIEDITELKRTQEESLTRQKLESLGVLAGGIAHDFNNLLGGILAEAEIVEADLPAGSSPVEEIQRIKAVAIHGAEIVRELMIYAGQDQTSLVEPVNLSRLVEEMLELLKVSISKQVVLKINLDRNLPTVWGNAPQIRQVVMNLVINASEAIGEKEGVVLVATSRMTGGLVNLPTGNYVRLEVSDTGCGMTEEVKTKIFDPFFSTKFPGRGLGLAVVQGIVRSQGGAIHLMSTPGQGTTLQVLLPCTSKRASDTPNVISSPGMQQSNARAGTILMVEDEELLRLAVSKALRKRGFCVIEARDGWVATDLLRTHIDELDVILLDVTLPGRSSREIFEEALRIRPDLKVILTSAYGRETVDATFTGMRVEYFIRKPFQLGELVRLLQDAIS